MNKLRTIEGRAVEGVLFRKGFHTTHCRSGPSQESEMPPVRKLKPLVTHLPGSLPSSVSREAADIPLPFTSPSPSGRLLIVGSA